MGDAPNQRPAWAEKVALLKKRHETGVAMSTGIETPSPTAPSEPEKLSATAVFEAEVNGTVVNIPPDGTVPVSEPTIEAPAVEAPSATPVQPASAGGGWLNNLGGALGLRRKKQEHPEDNTVVLSGSAGLAAQPNQANTVVTGAAVVNVVEAEPPNPAMKKRYFIEDLVNLSEEELDDLAGEMMRLWLEDGGDIDHDMDPFSVNAAIGEGKRKLPPPITNFSILGMLKSTLGEGVVNHYFEGTPVAEPVAETPLTPEQIEQAAQAELMAQLAAEVPQNGTVECHESTDKLHVTAKLTAAKNGGEEVTEDAVVTKLKDMGVIYGISDASISHMVQDKIYDQWMEIATGTEPLHGENGRINELYPRQLQLDLKEKPDGSVDFKEINTIQTVDKGSVICQIILPTQGVDGMTVRGHVLKGRNGLNAVVPSGDNTFLNEDRTKLLSATDGSLVFRGGKFHVEPVLRLENVDAGTGNVRFNGDIVVRGRVQAGYTIHCKGNIKVEGVVEGAEIYANGSILLSHGINGMGKGKLVAKGEVTSKFIESCSVFAGGKVKAETIVNSVVETDEGLEISGSKGRIVGGQVTSFGSIKARRVGARSAVQTIITLGVTPSIINQKMDIEKKIESMRVEMEEINKNLAFLEQQQRVGRLVNPDYINLLHQLRLQLPVQKMKFMHLEKTLAELDGKIGSTDSVQLVSQKIYPPTRVNIGRSSLVTKDIHENARIYMNMEGEITIGLA